MKLLRLQIKDSQRGASLVEYALLVAMIAVIAVTAAMALGQGVQDNLEDVSNQLSGESVTCEDAEDPMSCQQ